MCSRHQVIRCRAKQQLSTGQCIAQPEFVKGAESAAAADPRALVQCAVRVVQPMQAACVPEVAFRIRAAGRGQKNNDGSSCVEAVVWCTRRVDLRGLRHGSLTWSAPLAWPGCWRSTRRTDRIRPADLAWGTGSPCNEQPAKTPGQAEGQLNEQQATADQRSDGECGWDPYVGL